MNDISLKDMLLSSFIGQNSSFNESYSYKDGSNAGFQTYFENSKSEINASYSTINNSLNNKINTSDNSYKTYKIEADKTTSKKEATNKKSEKLEKTSTEQPETEVDNLKEKVDNLKEKVNENAYMILVYDQSLLNQISEILGVSAEEVVNIISEMGIAISDLAQPENLRSFLQETLGLENSEQLISVDNIKEIMTELIEIGSNIYYEEVIEPIENIEQIIESLNNSEQEFTTVLLTNGKENEDITKLLQELNGEVNEKVVVEAEDTTTEPTIEENAKEVLDQRNDVSNKNSTLTTSIKEEKVISVEQDLTLPEQMDFSDFENGTQNQNMFGQNLDNFTKTFEDGIDFNLQNSTSIETYDKVFTHATERLQAQRSINSIEVINQIMDKIKTSVKTDVSEIKLLLRPDFLGEVSLKISSQNGIITAQFIAENQKVKEIIESNFSQLKDMLNEQGVEVSQLDVSVNEHNANESSQTFEAFAFAKEKSEERIKNIINKVLEEESSTIEYVEENQIITSNVNYSV